MVTHFILSDSRVAFAEFGLVRHVAAMVHHPCILLLAFIECGSNITSFYVKIVLLSFA